MKIAIFGDSYAADHELGRGETTFAGWSNQLKTFYAAGGHTVDNYAQYGASTQYSFHEFLTHYKDYDRIIYFITNLHRFDYPMKFRDRIGCPQEIRHWCAPHFVDWPKSGQDYDERFLKFVEEYYVYLSWNPLSDQYELEKINAFMAHVKMLRPDTLFFPCFRAVKHLAPGYDWAMEDLYEYEGYIMGGNDKNKANHLTQKDSHWVFEHVLARLEKNKFIDWPAQFTRGPYWHLIK
jgi:hypothetical protein